MEFENVLPQKR